MKRERAVVAAVLTLAVPFAVPIAAPASAAESMTTITMSVSGCEGCTIIPTTTPAGSSDIYNGPKAKVMNGVATMTVPTSQTAGMYFGIKASWKSQVNAQPLIVFQYKGAQVGGSPTKAQAMAYTRASACWAGTTDAAVDIQVVVRRVWMPAFDPGSTGTKRTQVPIAWVLPTQNGLAPFWPTVKGVLAVQDSVGCKAA